MGFGRGVSHRAKAKVKPGPGRCHGGAASPGWPNALPGGAPMNLQFDDQGEPLEVAIQKGTMASWRLWRIMGLAC